VVATLSRRATDVAVGQEIVRFIVDEADAVQFVRIHDETRISDQMRWPDVMGANIVGTAPEPQRAELARQLGEVRAGRQPSAWLFPSAMREGELRLLHATPIRNHPGWVGLAVFAVPAEVELRSSGGGFGTTGKAVMATLASQFAVFT
jgi:hypothetical protein